MNIVAMGLPAFAYLDPTFYGTEGPADMAAWGINYVLSDGKMRALFTLLFGLLSAGLAAAGPPRADNPDTAGFVQPVAIFGQDDRTAGHFEPTVSRLIEMQSADYLRAPHKAEPVVSA